MKTIPRLLPIQDALITLMIAGEDRLRAKPECSCNLVEHLSPHRKCFNCRLIDAMRVIERETSITAHVPELKPRETLAGKVHAWERAVVDYLEDAMGERSDR